MSVVVNIHPGPIVVAGEPAWATGAALQQQLAHPISLVWSENPLRPAIQNLSRVRQVAVLLDRRVDPEQRLDVKLSAVPLGAALREIAHSRQLGVAWVGPVAYFGPPQAAGRIRTLAALREAEARMLGTTAGRRLLQQRPMTWDDLATPRDLLEQLAKEVGGDLVDLERVPHDLWAAADLPPLAWVARMTLVLNQFDLTFAMDDNGREIRLVPIPKDLVVSREPDDEAAVKGMVPFSRPSYAGAPRNSGQSSDLPPSKPTEAPAAKPSAPGAKIRISRLGVQEKPVGKVLKQLAAKLDFELRMDQEAIARAGISLDQRVSFQAENASLDEVLRGLLQATPLTYRRRGNVVEVFPK